MSVRYYLIAASVLVISLSAAGQEKKIERSALPAIVERAVEAETQGATIKGFAQEREHGKTFYEAETVVNGHTRDVLFATDGTIAEIEEEVDFDSLSVNVRAGLTEKAAGGKITKVESLTKRGKLVAYEGHVKRGSKPSEIQVDPDGKSLAHEE